MGGPLTLNNAIAVSTGRNCHEPCFILWLLSYRPSFPLFTITMHANCRSIKSDKERRRLEEERQIQQLAELEAATGHERQIQEGLRLEEERALEEVAERERARKDREAARYSWGSYRIK